MRNRYASLVAAFAAGALIACSDAAVDTPTAPPLTATPAPPVANQWPYISDYDMYGIPSAIGIQMGVDGRFEDDYTTFVATGTVSFQWANDVSAKVNAWLLNKNGQTINSGAAAMSWQRLFLPVAQGDTTFEVRVSTFNIKCGLVGKTSYEGKAAQVAVDFRLVQITLYQQGVGPTTGADASQPACPPPPGCEEPPPSRVIAGVTGILASESEDCDAPSPPGGRDESYEVCVSVWRQLWLYDYYTGMSKLIGEWFIGTICYVITLGT